jgi:hypothetical protein
MSRSGAPSITLHHALGSFGSSSRPGSMHTVRSVPHSTHSQSDSAYAVTASHPSGQTSTESAHAVGAPVDSAPALLVTPPPEGSAVEVVSGLPDDENVVVDVGASLVVSVPWAPAVGPHAVGITARPNHRKQRTTVREYWTRSREHRPRRRDRQRWLAQRETEVATAQLVGAVRHAIFHLRGSVILHARTGRRAARIPHEVPRAVLGLKSASCAAVGPRAPRLRRKS